MTDLNQFKTFQGHFTDQGYKLTFLLNCYFSSSYIVFPEYE
jgi:hypothetical protein